MPPLFNYFKIPDCFIGWPVPQKIEYYMQRISVNLKMIAMKINLTITMTYLQLETRIMHYRNLRK